MQVGNGPDSRSCCLFQLKCVLEKTPDDLIQRMKKKHTFPCVRKAVQVGNGQESRSPGKQCRLEMDQSADHVVYFN